MKFDSLFPTQVQKINALGCNVHSRICINTAPEVLALGNPPALLLFRVSGGRVVSNEFRIIFIVICGRSQLNELNVIETNSPL